MQNDRRDAAIRPLLDQLAKFEVMAPFREEPDNSGLSPGVYLTLAQWRAIMREFS